jgi:hypothetical protein
MTNQEELTNVALASVGSQVQREATFWEVECFLGDVRRSLRSDGRTGQLTYASAAYYNV